MHEPGKSDRPIVPKKVPNNAGKPAAEGLEGEGLAEGNSRQQNTSRTQSRSDVRSALERVRQKAVSEPKMRFTTLLHHIYNMDTLRGAFLALKREAAAGVDGVTWQCYGEDMEGNLQDLSERLKRGAYRAKPVRRVFIPKPDGRQRPLGVTALEDKIVQRATVEVLNAIYEKDFAGFSYGFRPGRCQHHALDALYVALDREKVNWVLDADIRAFFDTINHEWLMKFVEHRIADQRVLRLIRKWLTAGVMEGGSVADVEEGTPQGGVISPLLANIYLHYAFDLWICDWRVREAKGRVIVVRYADDFIVGFEHRQDAERFTAELEARLRKFGLELHPEKTRLIEFGRSAEDDRRGRGLGKPESFNFLGFAHRCGRTRTGSFMVLRHTMRKRLLAKLREVRSELQRRLHDTIPKVGEYLRSVVGGHMRYYGVPTNSWSLAQFRLLVTRLWRRILARRSQRGSLLWDRMQRLVERWLPLARVSHPFPRLRFGVMT